MAITKSRIYTAAASAARSESGDSGPIGVVENFDEMLACLAVGAASEGDSLDVSYEVSPDGGATWITHSAFAPVTAAGTALLKLDNLGTLGRIAWSIGGDSPSFTFAVRLVCKRRG